MIKGNRIDLRVVREEDLETLFGFLSDIENRGDFYPINLWSEPEFKKAFQENGFWSEDYGKLLIVSKDGRILGEIFYFKAVRYFDALEVGYILYDEANRGQGYMTEALSLMVKFLFHTKRINRLQLTVIPGNGASKQVATKCGFRSEGVLRQAMFHKGQFADMEMFALLREDAQTG